LYCVNQLKADRINWDKHGEKKKIEIFVNPVNPVQKDISYLPKSQTASIIKNRGFDSFEVATS